jgi:hypothetical protein
MEETIMKKMWSRFFGILVLVLVLAACSKEETSYKDGYLGDAAVEENGTVSQIGTAEEGWEGARDQALKEATSGGQKAPVEAFDRAKAEAIVNQANLQLNEMISEQEIMKQAYAQANAVVEAATAQAQEILNSAAADANEIRMGAMQYTDSMLANMQSIIQNTMESYNSRYASLINSLNGYYEMIAENRQELAPTIYGEPVSYEEMPQEEEA